MESHDEQTVKDGLGKRYAFKLGSSLLCWPINVLIQLMVTRALGPVGYGSYSYLTVFFTNVIGFCDSGSSNGFYSKLCSRPSEDGLKLFYWRFAAVLGMASMCIVAAIGMLDWREVLWPEQPMLWVFLSLLVAIGTWYVGIGEKIIDAHALTARGEPSRLLIRFVGFATLGLLFLLGYLGIVNLLICLTVLSILQILVWQRVMKNCNESFMPRRRLFSKEVRRYARELWDYSHPLAMYMLVSAGGALVDRWLLQHYAGSEQQGFYGLSYQVGAFCFIFSSAMVPLLVREFAEAHQTGDTLRMSQSFRLNLPRFYTLAAMGAIFMSFQADRISVLVGGDRFAGAAWSMTLMCLYPIHQTYGQLSGSLFYATGNTRLYRNIGIICTAVGMLLSYVFIAPARLGGAGLGSAGLAYKMLIIQLLTTNIQLWFNCRHLQLSFGWFVRHQCSLVLVICFMAAAARSVSNWMSSPLIGVLVSTACYGLLIGLMVPSFPRLFGLTKEDIRLGVDKIRALLSSSATH